MDPKSIIRLFSGIYVAIPFLLVQDLIFPSEYGIFYVIGFMLLLKTFAEDVYGAYCDVMMFPFRYLKGFFPKSWDKPIGEKELGPYPFKEGELEEILYNKIKNDPKLKHRVNDPYFKDVDKKKNNENE